MAYDLTSSLDSIANAAGNTLWSVKNLFTGNNSNSSTVPTINLANGQEVQNTNSPQTWGEKLTDPNWWFSPIGSGDNAVTPAQLGVTGGLGLLGIMNQRKQFGAQLEQARKQFEFSKGLSQANFATQGTNFLNQGLFQLEGLKAFNPNAGAERAQNLSAAVNQLNAAGSRIGMGNNTFQDQQNAISRYNQLQWR